MLWLFVVPCELEATIEAVLCTDTLFIWVIKPARDVDAV